jgi:hypothetical protein
MINIDKFDTTTTLQNANPPLISQASCIRVKIYDFPRRHGIHQNGFVKNLQSTLITPTRLLSGNQEKRKEKNRKK